MWIFRTPSRGVDGALRTPGVKNWRLLQNFYGSERKLVRFLEILPEISGEKIGDSAEVFGRPSKVVQSFTRSTEISAGFRSQQKNWRLAQLCTDFYGCRQRSPKFLRDSSKNLPIKFFIEQLNKKFSVKNLETCSAKNRLTATSTAFDKLFQLPLGNNHQLIIWRLTQVLPAFA